MIMGRETERGRERFAQSEVLTDWHTRSNDVTLKKGQCPHISIFLICITKRSNTHTSYYMRMKRKQNDIYIVVREMHTKMLAPISTDALTYEEKHVRTHMIL